MRGARRSLWETESSTLRVVATSRELLGMPGGSVLAVCRRWTAPGPIRRPSSSSGDERTLLGPARSPPPSVDTISAIVRRLDGLPLAIGLAAARVATLGIADLGEQIEASVAYPTRLGGLSRRGGKPRHRTLRAAIEWSERLLPESAKDALAQWTVFAGAVSLANAQAVLQVGPEVIEELASHSLLSVEIRSGKSSYRMLQTVRSVVGPASAVSERRHLEYFSAVAAQAAAALQTPDEAAAHQRLVELVDELRLAHNRARRIDVEAAVRMSMSLHRFGVSRLHTELLGWAAKLAPLVQDRPDLRAAVNSSIAYRYVIAEQLDACRAESAQRARQRRRRPDPVSCAGSTRRLLHFSGRPRSSPQLVVGLATVGRRAGETYYELIGHVGFVMALAYGGQHGAARNHLDEAERCFANATLCPTHLGLAGISAGGGATR